MWLKVVIYLHLVWHLLLNHLVVLKQSAVVGNTFTGHESSVPEDASVTRLCLTKCFLDWIDQCEHQTRLPLPMTCKRVSVLSESSLINLKCNSKTNTTVTLTKSSVLWVLRGRLEIHLQHLDFALDVDWHCLPILKTPDETPDVLDVGVQDWHSCSGIRGRRSSTLAVPVRIPSRWVSQARRGQPRSWPTTYTAPKHARRTHVLLVKHRIF